MAEITHTIYWNRLNIKFHPNSYRMFPCFKNLKYSFVVLQGWEQTQYPQKINVAVYEKQIKNSKITVGKQELTWFPSLSGFICLLALLK